MYGRWYVWLKHTEGGGADFTPMMEIEYQGQTTEVEALFLLSIEGKDLLSWQILQKLSDGVSILGQ